MKQWTLYNELFYYSGIYILKDLINEILYIGSSHNLYRRIPNSIRKYEKKHEYKVCKVDIYLTHNYTISRYLELLFINKYNPTENKLKSSNQILYTLSRKDREHSIIYKSYFLTENGWKLIVNNTKLFDFDTVNYKLDEHDRK